MQVWTPEVKAGPLLCLGNDEDCRVFAENELGMAFQLRLILLFRDLVTHWLIDNEVASVCVAIEATVGQSHSTKGMVSWLNDHLFAI